MWFKRCWFRFTGWLGLWPLWCKVYQWIFERGVIRKPARPWAPLDPCWATILAAVLKWRADGWRELGNAAHHPAYTKAAIAQILAAQGVWEKACSVRTLPDLEEALSGVVQGKGQPGGPMDCEDFALWGATVLDPKLKPRVLCVYWNTGRWPWQIEGHAVCVYQRGDTKYGYLCNGRIVEGPYLMSLGDVVNNILKRSGKTGSDLVAVREYEAKEMCIKS